MHGGHQTYCRFVQVGIGLPNPIPGTPGRLLVDWARQAESAGFSALATIDRIAYPSYESLVALAAAAGATERIGLMSNILLAPTRSPVLLAKEAASVDQLSGGRLVLGLGVGGRPDDFEVTGTNLKDRGRRLDEALELMHRAWRGEPVAGSSQPLTPRPFNGERVPIMFGGGADPVLRRVARWGVGWTAGGGAAERMAPMMEKVRAAWQEAGREGEPRFAALTYFALGPDSERGREYLADYYGPFAERMWPRVPRTPDAIREAAEGYRAAGVDELFFDPSIASLDQVDLLAKAIL